ncbi:putative fungal pheromone precursor Mr_Ph4.1 [Moniliophthora roreri]|uniref:Pheromone Mr_Ph4.1 n=1 Tax=Moniliophthora roreri TaxID=221103 RepID=A0A0W0FP28_MONRR|nr:pheromone precursor Mr_Ph4.1 [Moniliophthora roreri]KAI3609908.1 putative fungal pheromone precursor Mr_Ph4.1 [Moniliophthora roreri]
MDSFQQLNVLLFTQSDGSDLPFASPFSGLEECDTSLPPSFQLKNRVRIAAEFGGIPDSLSLPANCERDYGSMTDSTSHGGYCVIT